MATPYLNVTQVTAGQNNKEITLNDADFAIEQATQRALVVDMSGGNVTLTVNNFTRNGLFRAQGLTDNRTLTIPTNMGAGANTGRRLFLVNNESDYRLTVTCTGGTGYTIPARINALCYLDGTNIEGIIAGQATQRRHDVSFFFPGELLPENTMVRYVVATNFRWEVGLGGSQGEAVFAPDGGDVEFIIYKNGFVIGAMTFANGVTTATFDHPTATDFAPGDILEIATPDDTFDIASVAVTIVGFLQ